MYRVTPDVFEIIFELPQNIAMPSQIQLSLLHSVHCAIASDRLGYLKSRLGLKASSTDCQELPCKGEIEYLKLSKDAA